MIATLAHDLIGNLLIAPWVTSGDLYMQELLRRGGFDVQPAATGPRAKIPNHDRTRLRFARDSLLEGTGFDFQFRVTRCRLLRPPRAASPAITGKATLVLETRFETADSVVTLVDGMGRRDGCADLVRIIRGERGRVAVRMELVIRCEYGSIIPWVRRLDDHRLTAVAGSDRLTLSTPAAVHGENLRTIAEFDIAAGEEILFSLTWSPSYRRIRLRRMPRTRSKSQRRAG
jgi:hypothetical protein